jgi:hypothetical protein
MRDLYSRLGAAGYVSSTICFSKFFWKVNAKDSRLNLPSV